MSNSSRRRIAMWRKRQIIERGIARANQLGRTAYSLTREAQYHKPHSNIRQRYHMKIKLLGTESCNRYVRWTSKQGKDFHVQMASSLLNSWESYTGSSSEIQANLRKSVESFINGVSSVKLVEYATTYRGQNYRGRVDAVIVYKSKLTVVEWKTAERPPQGDIRPDLFDKPLQVAAYCGALNNDPSVPEYLIDRNIDSGLIVVAYRDGSEASLYHLDGNDMIKAFVDFVERHYEFEQQCASQ